MRKANRHYKTSYHRNDWSAVVLGTAKDIYNENSDDKSNSSGKEVDKSINITMSLFCPMCHTRSVRM